MNKAKKIIDDPTFIYLQAMAMAMAMAMAKDGSVSSSNERGNTKPNIR